MSGPIIYSSATGGTMVAKYTNSMITLLTPLLHPQKPVVKYLDVEPEDKQMVWSVSGKKGVYPLLFCNGKFIGDWETVEGLNEEGQLAPLLK